MCKKDKTQVKRTYEVFSYIQWAKALFDRACMYMNISYIIVICGNWTRMENEERNER